VSFVERVIGHVRRVQQVAEGAAHDKRVVIDYGRHEARVLDLLGRKETNPGPWVELGSTAVLDWFVEELHWVLLAGPASELVLDERSSLVDVAIAKAVGGSSEPVALPWLTPVRLRWLESASHTVLHDAVIWFADLSSWTWPYVPRYCAEVGLVAEADQGQWRVTRAGELLLKLRGRDVVEWLLTLETQMAAGLDDTWRVGVELLLEVSNQGEALGYSADPSPSHMEARRSHLERLSSMGLLVSILDARDRPKTWRLTELGHEVIDEVSKGLDGPMGVLARAFRDDERSAIAGPTTTVAVPREHLHATILHARMVAHEVRNALGPVQHASRTLRSSLLGDAMRSDVIEALDAIDQGISRLHRFVTESVRLVPPEPQRLAQFSVLEAIAEARKELVSDGVGSLTIETLPVSADPRCNGNRGRFVMAMLNVLRNAQQAAGRQVQIAIRVDARDVQQLVLSIEDDGPGVPDAVREHVFENGVSYREDGTGHGLASVRAVVEEMGGKVRCTTSELGGAKFEIVLPMTEASA
jgi:signal transduction histidine kinase